MQPTADGLSLNHNKEYFMLNHSHNNAAKNVPTANGFSLTRAYFPEYFVLHFHDGASVRPPIHFLTLEFRPSLQGKDRKRYRKRNERIVNSIFRRTVKSEMYKVKLYEFNE